MQSIYLLDTNVISEMTKPIQNQPVIERIFETQKQSNVCAITFAECMYGLKRIQNEKKRDLLFDFYINTIQTMYKFVDFDIHAANMYSDLKERLERIGKPVQELDLQIASIAIANNLILVTRNVKDFDAISEVSNLMLENWFTKN